tara:strand:- start:4152 stop:5885 length:1734 start_codon:yes stop_codon:yes gene_type:complete
MNNTFNRSNYFINKIRNGALTICGIILLVVDSSAQNLNVIDKDAPLVVSGSVTTGFSAYASENRKNRRNPFSYYITAAPTVSFKGISLPFSFTYRDQKGSLSQPFERIKFNPEYKWFKLGVGNTTLDLNKYVFGGQYFKGVSLELTPGKFKFKAGYGNLENPLSQIDNGVLGAEILPVYKRKTAALLVGYGSSTRFVELTLFRAKDELDPNISGPDLKNQVIPQENIAGGLKFGLPLSKRISIKLNGAASALTSDLESVEILPGDTTGFLLKTFTKMISYNISTKIYYAGDVSINFKMKNFGTGFEYKLVSPMYKSLGTYYFQEDYENYTLKMNFNALKSKLRFNGKAGLQRNNLNKLKESTRTRKIINASLMIAPTKSFSTTLRAANFQSERLPTIERLNDSLTYTQTSETYSIVPVLLLKNKNKITTISVMGSYLKLVDLGLNLAGSVGVDNYTANVTYALTDKKSGVGLSGSLLFNKNIVGLNQNQRIGANFGYSKSIKEKKGRLNANLGFTKNSLNQESDGSSINTGFGFKYKVKKKLSAGINTNFVFRISETSPYQEYRVSARVSYSFTSKK